ncbi:MAG: hypothetical protein KDI51_00015 [Xanthomonadales bacterium]|nr:hypothetical protein [Xanthomonadales bacterium]
MKVRTLTPAGVMKPLGPYSHIAVAGPHIAISATAGVDPTTGQLAGPDVYAQASQILRSFQVLLAEVGASLTSVLHVHVFLLSMDDYEAMNRAYREAFAEHWPARTVVGVSALPKTGALVTMNLTAVGDEGLRPAGKAIST